MTEPQEPISGQLQIASSPEAEIGHYADFVAVWHQKTSFVLDFMVFASVPQVVEGQDGKRVINQLARLAARVRIPPEQVFEIMKALEKQLSQWEIETGQRRPDPDQ